MPIGLTVRLVAKPRWGTVRPAYSQSLTSDEAIRRAKKANGLKGVRLIYPDKAGSESGFEGDDSKCRPIGLQRELYFPETYNKKTGQWRMAVGSADDLQEYPEEFDGPGLGYINHRKSDGMTHRAVIVSQQCTAFDGTELVGSGGFPFLENAPWAIEFYLPKPIKDDKCPVWQARWPGSTVGKKKFPGWQLQVVKGQAEICLLAPKIKDAPGWTEAREDALFDLLAIENPTSGNQEDIDEIRAEIYTVRQSISFTGDWYNTIRRLEFYPEERGVLNITDGAQTMTVVHPEIAKARKDYPLWNAGPLYLITNGPAYFYRAGFPWFLTAGTIGYGRTKSRPWSGSLPLMQFTVLKDVSGPGTSVTFANHVYESIPQEDADEIVVSSEVKGELATTHRRYTPYVYAAHSFIPASERSGGEGVVFDSGDEEFADAAGIGPVIDCIPHFENGRRTSYTLRVRDSFGQTFTGLGFNYDTLEGCMCNLFLDGDQVMGDALIQTVRLIEMASGEYNKTRQEVTHAWTQVEFEIADQNAIVDEHLVKEDPVGDKQDLNNFNKKLLNLVGVKSSKISIASGGRLNPTARPGEDWATRPQKACSLGDYMRRHNEKHGMGSMPAIGVDGIWRMIDRPTTIATIDGHEAHFSSHPADNSRSSYPGRFAVLAPLEGVRDVTEFFNLFRIEGGEDSEGVPLVATWEIPGSAVILGNPTSRSLIGRVREYIVNDSGLRTLDDVLWVRRSLILQYGDHPRFYCFKTFYHKNLFPGDLITVDGTLCRIWRIPGGSARDDSMNLVCREVAG